MMRRRVWPHIWYDTGAWDLSEMVQNHPAEGLVPLDSVEIPNKLIHDMEAAEHQLEMARKAVAEAITDYVDKNPETRLHQTVANAVEQVRRERERKG